MNPIEVIFSGLAYSFSLESLKMCLIFCSHLSENQLRYMFIYIDEGVRPVAWQQCKHSLFDVREREGCLAATGCETGWRQRQFAVAVQLVKSGQDW